MDLEHIDLGGRSLGHMRQRWVERDGARLGQGRLPKGVEVGRAQCAGAVDLGRFARCSQANAPFLYFCLYLTLSELGSLRGRVPTPRGYPVPLNIFLVGTPPKGVPANGSMLCANMG